MDFVSKEFSFLPGERCVVIGEIGVNHNNDRAMLFELLDRGAEAGCDIIKLQRFKDKNITKKYRFSILYNLGQKYHRKIQTRI